MTPYEIDVLLWYHCRALDHPDMERNPPVWRPTITGFMEERLVRRVEVSEQNPTYPRCYSLTDRGRAYAESLQRVPLPVAAWITEWPTDEPTRKADAVDPVEGVATK